MKNLLLQHHRMSIIADETRDGLSTRQLAKGGTAVTVLSGGYRRVNEAHLREKSARDDPRREFYAAMLRHDTYDAYLADVGSRVVNVEGYKAGPITGRMEILYCRRNGWIEDVAPADLKADLSQEALAEIALKLEAVLEDARAVRQLTAQNLLATGDLLTAAHALEARFDAFERHLGEAIRVAVGPQRAG